MEVQHSQEKVGGEQEPAYLGSIPLRDRPAASATGDAVHRLVTLTGPGGTGKTRLALQVAADLVDEFEHGVYFVNLAPISDPDLVIPTIKHTLGLPESGNHSPLGHLAAYLREKQFLLLLDNFEHLLPAASQLPELLATCPRLKLLVTSRTTLHVKGEYEIAVPRWPFLTCSRCPPMRPCRR